jgi:plasmid segregation protein ParM
MAAHQTVRAIDVGYGNTKFTLDERGTCRVFPSLAPLADARALRSGVLADRRTRIVTVDGLAYEVGPDVTLFADSPLLHSSYIEAPEYRALVYGALDTMQVSQVDLLVTGLPVHLHQLRSARLKQLLTGKHVIRQDLTVTIAEVAVVAQPVGGLIAYSQECEEWATTQSRIRLLIDPGLFSLDWLVVQGLKEVPGLSQSIEGGVCEVLKGVAQQLTSDFGECYGNLRKIDDGLRGAPWQIHGQPADVDRYRAIATAAAARHVRTMRNYVVSQLRSIEEIVLVGGGATHFEPAIRSAFPDLPLTTVEDPITANVRGFQVIGRSLKQRKAA